MAVVRERKGAEFEFVTAWGFGRDVLDGRTGDLVGAEVLAALVRGRRPVYVDLREECFAGSSLRLTGMRWLWVGPFRAGRMDGLIMAASMTGRPARQVGAVLEDLAEIVGRSAENAQMITRERDRARLMTHLADFGNFAVSSFEEEHLRKAATAALRSMFPQGAGYIMALDPGSGALKVAEVFGSDIERTEMGGCWGGPNATRPTVVGRSAGAGPTKGWATAGSGTARTGAAERERARSRARRAPAATGRWDRFT